MGRKAWGLILAVMLLSVAAGCADNKTPKGAIMLFFKAIGRGDDKKIGECLSFDRLLLEKMGEAYLNLSPDEKHNQADEMRSRMVASIKTGRLSFLAGIDPVVEDTEIKGDQARVLVRNRKNKEDKMFFLLVREGGVWKIFSISGNQPA